MASSKDSIGNRRKSFNIFSRTSFPGLTQINPDLESNVLEENSKKLKINLRKRASIFGLGLNANPSTNQDGPLSPLVDRYESQKVRPRTLQKGRPLSVFGSLGKKSVTNDEFDPLSNKDIEVSPTEFPQFAICKTVLYHGEIQTTSGMFRKKKEYLVLTDTHLIRFKNHIRASDAFPLIPLPAGGRSNSVRQQSTTSIGSWHDVQSTGSHTSFENENRIPLSQIVSVYRVEDGRAFTTEVVYLDEECHGAGSIQLILHDPKEADLWQTSIRGAAEKSRLLAKQLYPQRVVNYLVSALEREDDYESSRFRVFRVVKRAPASKTKSSDELHKLGSNVYYFVIGINRIHLIPVPDYSNPSGQLILPKTSRSTYGVVSLVNLKLSNDDDKFEIAFRSPLSPAEILDLAATTAPDIAISILKTWQFLKPFWEDHNFNFSGPRNVISQSEPSDTNNEDLGCFDRTLVAYCLAYKVAPTNIQYAVDWEAEDSPEFQLWHPRYSKNYSIPELLAVLRALRYNEYFCSISLKDIDLHNLHGTIDLYGNENATLETRSGISLPNHFNLRPQNKSLLYQEVQALAVKSTRLKRMDFANTLPRRRPKDNFDNEGGEMDKDPGCEIVGALLPLCQNQITNVTWVILSGIELGETDLEFLIPGLFRPQAKMRAIEFSHCGLTDRGIMQLITHLERQNKTIEVINFSGNPGRISLQDFQGSMSRFTNIRSLNLSRTAWTAGEEPLILPEVLLTWKLEELILSGIVVNEQTVNSISIYLASKMSNQLRLLQMEQCNLSGEQVACLMHSMVRDGEVGRDLKFNVSGNRVEKGIGEIVKAIEENHTPTKLYLRMIEFTKEDYFRQLLQALRSNTTIRCLDISKASLPDDAGVETCECLRAVFADNQTLDELDISGEQSHLEVTRFGIGLNYALTGLESNNTLKLLRIEYQNLGLEGANTLSSVIEKNTGLTHILCEHNDINLQGFTTLVNSLAKNTTILEIPFLQNDQTACMRRINASMRETKHSMANTNRINGVRSSVHRTLHHLGVSKPSKQETTPQDVEAVLRILNERWEYETNRLRKFLERNNAIANGYSASYGEGLVSEAELRPTTALSDREILEQALSNTTPRINRQSPVEDYISFKSSGETHKSKEYYGSNFLNTENEKNSKGMVSQVPEIDSIRLPELTSLGDEKLFGLEEEDGLLKL
ncbi:putative leucine rich repeat protein [Erysiphe necator]|uniref:Putative leucine rich repeat protein n=1 Tax=Uncinula necator TaxID=52586 RepID=A0A0B1P6R9_UNCNE|nr:putative leucine rich repeat protein [Erysiphe necator]